MTRAEKLVYGEVMASGESLCLAGDDLKTLQEMIKPLYAYEYSPSRDGATGNHLADSTLIELLRSQRNGLLRDRMALLAAANAMCFALCHTPSHPRSLLENAINKAYDGLRAAIKDVEA